MKITKIADEIIKYCVKRFYKTGETTFYVKTILSILPKEDEELIYSSIRLLSADGLLRVFYSDNVPDTFELLVVAINQTDENTLLKKGYSFFKALAELR